MSEAFFAGVYGVDDSRLPAEAKLECKICWHVYDPTEGDPVWQVLPGTAFANLPDHWTCPQCGSPKQDFLVMED
ncbi:rubredoxin [Methylomonas sp. AM2-LC]|uniref:rubredoxin n=1 Tax=Methylomonas sp. AM2-LC TaxID=3153301 RepID=UPI003265722C